IISLAIAGIPLVFRTAFYARSMPSRRHGGRKSPWDAGPIMRLP
ncbi:MAG: hypothetical protein, partial [Olavius algarvensis Gamma 1 endosymbiont]